MKKSLIFLIACCAVLPLLLRDNGLFAQFDFTVTAPYTSPARNTCGAGDNCTNQSSEEHVYKVTIPANGDWTFSLCGSSYDTWLEIGTGVCGSNIAIIDDFCGLQSEITVTITAGIYYVSVEGYGTACGSYVLDISGPVPDDAGVIAINSPTSSCGLSSAENVTVSVTNFGINSQTNIPVSYRINGGPIVTEFIPGPLASGNSTSYTFVAAADLSSPTTYSFDAWTTLTGDASTSNDSLTNYLVNTGVFIENICIIDYDDTSTFNYNCNFSNDICADGYEYGDTTMTTSLPIIIGMSIIDSISFYLYYTDCGIGTDFILSLNGVQIGTFTDMLGECICNSSTYPYIYTITDSAMLNAAWSDTNSLGVIHNGTTMAIAGYSASIYAHCLPSSFLEVTDDTAVCIGNYVDLTVSVNDSVSFPAPYNFLWSPATGLSCTACENPVANPATTTTYMVMATDSSGANDSAFVTITVFSSPPLANAGNDSEMCEYESVQLNASGGISYSWSPVTALSNSNVSNPYANPLTTTTYTVTVSNSCGSNSDAVTVLVNTLPAANAGADTAVCLGNSIQLNATGGVSYLWISGTGLNDTTIANPYASPVVTTVYTVEVTDGNGCVNTDSVSVTVAGTPIFTSSVRDSVCPGDTTTLFAYSCSPELFYDGFEDGTYNKWTNAGGGYTITATSSTAAVGTYSLQLMGGNWAGLDGVFTNFNQSAADYAGFYIKVPTTSDYAGYITIGNDSTAFNGGIIYFVADWTGVFNMNGINNTYNANQWYHIEYKNIDFISSTFDYYIDGSLIQSNVSFYASSSYISQIHLSNISPGSTSYFDEITVGAPCSGIDSTLSYSWTPVGGLSNPNIADPVASVNTTTTYIVTASGSGCSSADTITIYATILEVAAGSGSSFICNGDAVQLDASANVVGASFSWSPATGLSCINCSDPLASPTSTTTYYVTATSGSCTDIDSILITVANGPIAPSCTPTTTGYCCGMGIYNVTFNTLNNTSNDGIESYQDYSCTYSTNITAGASYSIFIQTGTSYEENVRVWIDYNNNGVFDNDSTTELAFWSDAVFTNHSGTISILSSAIINTPLRMRVASDFYGVPTPVPCNNVTYGQVEDYSIIILPNTIPPAADFDFAILDMCQGIVSFSDQSLNNPTSWYWDFGDGSGISVSQNPYYNYNSPGTYTVKLIVTNPFGADTITQQVAINSIIANFTVSSNAVGISENVSFFDNSTGAYIWNWDFGDGFSSTLQNPIHSYLSAGTYNVTLMITGSSGCVAQMTLQIMVCAGMPQTGAITGPVNVIVAGTTNYSVLFSTGSIYNWTVIGGIQTSGGQTNSISVLWTTAGNGQVMVVESDSLGCTGDTVSLNINAEGVGLDEFQISDFGFQIIPNPNNGVFNLKIIQFENLKMKSVEIYNMLGENVYSSSNDQIKTISFSNFQIDISDNSAGIYHLEIITGEGRVHEKVVLE